MINRSSRVLQKHFSVYTNQGHQVIDIIGGKEVKYDHNINQYEPVIQAFLQKRKTKKVEVAPKISIIEPLQSITPQLEQQKLQPLKQLYNLEQQQKVHQHQAYNTQYIISLVSEPHFKNMMDEYLEKVLISGGVVPLEDYSKQENIKEKVMTLYRKFFFGDELSDLEREIEFRYLALKQSKFFKFQQTDKNRYRSLWTYSQQRRVELMSNWRYRDPNLFDDIRPIYEPLHISKKLKNQQQMIDINQEGYQRQFMFKFFESRFFNSKSKKFYEFVTQYLQTRTMLYINSIEFNRILSIPPDFHIEHSILNMHMWMVTDRLKKINTRESKLILKDLEYYFKRYTLDKIGKIHLKKKNDFIKDVNHFMGKNRQAFDKHFNQLYVEDSYERIDALVWSSIFFEKIDRYSEEVYLMSEYFIQNYRYMQDLSYEQLIDCDIQWDVYRISFDYKDKILARNPQLTKEEFQEEFDSDKKSKKYYYSYELPIQEEQAKADQVSEVANKARYSMFKTIRKYQNMETYDYYSEREEEEKKQKKNQKKEEKSAWVQQSSNKTDNNNNQNNSNNNQILGNSLVDHDEDYIQLLKLQRRQKEAQRKRKLQEENETNNNVNNNKNNEEQTQQQQQQDSK